MIQIALNNHTAGTVAAISGLGAGGGSGINQAATTEREITISFLVNGHTAATSFSLGYWNGSVWAFTPVFAVGTAGAVISYVSTNVILPSNASRIALAVTAGAGTVTPYINF